MPPQSLPHAPCQEGNSAGPSEAERQAHVALLRQHAVTTCRLMDTHAFRFEAQRIGDTVTSASSKKRIRDVMKAVTALEANMPIAWHSSVHVAVDEDRQDVLRVLILPDQDTPYANGAFVFDMLLPAKFPESPPKVRPPPAPLFLAAHPREELAPARLPERTYVTADTSVALQMSFLTTGGGTVRFNPNLYNCGKVCLSLLGTWSGPSWDPQTSTVLQVLVSLQAMVFCPEPYYNEPGWDSQRGTANGTQQMTAYNTRVIQDTAKWAIAAVLEAPMKHPHGVFADVLCLHWANKRSVIERMLSDSGVPADICNRVCSHALLTSPTSSWCQPPRERLCDVGARAHRRTARVWQTTPQHCFEWCSPPEMI